MKPHPLPAGPRARRPGVVFFSLLTLLLISIAACKPKSDPAPESAATGGDFLALMNIGRSQYEKGDAAAAVASFEKAVAQQPTSIDARLNYANALLLDSKPEPALAQAREVIDMDPMSGAANYIAGAASLRLRQFEDALKYLQQAKEIDRTVNEVSFLLGLAYEGLKNNADAETQWKETIQFGPDHPAAYYRLSQLLLRQGRADEAEPLLEKHREVTAGKMIPSDPSFLEQCVYTQIRVPFVLAQPEEKGIEVQYVDVTEQWLPATASYGGPAGLIDFQRLGQPGLFVIEDGKQFRLLTFTNEHFEPVGNPVAARPGADYTRVLTGDLDNDRFEDAIVLGPNQSHVIKLAADARMSDRTLLTGLAQLKAVDGALADVDFTSKLSLVVTLPDGQGIRLQRNLGNLSFKDDTAAAGLPTEAFPARHVTISDWNKDDLPDLIITDDTAPVLFANQRGGTFAKTNPLVALPASQAVVINDMNNDLRPDMVLLETNSSLWISQGVEPPKTALGNGRSFAGIVSLDYDNDGWLDLLAYGNTDPLLFRNLGEKGYATMPLPSASGLQVKHVLAADLDNDCDTDLVFELADGSLKLFRNDGGNQNHMVKFKPVGSRSNSGGVGARFELTSGNWRTMRVAGQTPLEIGVGQLKQIDSMRIQWSQMRMNVESIPTEPCRVSFITEVVQAQMTSCPYLYKWNGTTFEFVSDFLSAAPVGLPAAPGKIIAADPEELLWLGNSSTFPERDGRHLLKLTEELSEVLYLDEVKLVAVDHPAGSRVFSTSKLLPGPPFMPHEIVTVRDPIGLQSAVIHRSDGEEDVTDSLRRVDNVRVAPDRIGDHVMGYSQPVELVLDFGPLDSSRPLVLALNGWLRFGGAMGNIAASQRPELPFPFPVLEAETANGWQPVDVTVGAPAGRTKNIIADLNGKLPDGTRRLKLKYAFDLYWDEIALFEKAGESGTRVTWLSPDSTDLQYRGFSAKQDLDWTHPTTPVHDQLMEHPLVPKVPTGWVTRYGAVDPLVTGKDNAFALINGGDALTVAFDASQLPPLAEGYERDFFMWSVGWDKDTDYHTVAGDTIEPLPWHGMNDQEYTRQSRPTFDSDALMNDFNTRWASPHVPPRKVVAEK